MPLSLSPYQSAPHTSASGGRSPANPSWTKSFEMSLVELVGTNTQVPPRRLLAGSRGRADVARARQLAMYLLHVSAGWKMAEVGRVFGRDRTTVGHACGRVEDRRDCPAFDSFVSRLEGRVAALAANYNEPAPQGGEDVDGRG